MQPDMKRNTRQTVNPGTVPRGLERRRTLTVTEVIFKPTGEKT